MSQISKAAQYRSFYDVAKKITNPGARLAFYDALDAYRFDGIEPENLPLEADIAFTAIKANIDADLGRKHAGAPEGNQNARKQLKNNSETIENNSKQLIDLEKTNNVDVNEDVNVNENANEELCACSAPTETPVLKIGKSEFDLFLNRVFNLIRDHNKTHAPARKMPISRDIFSFRQSEGRQLCNVLHDYDAPTILTALTNYLHVADMDTWKSSFTFTAFCTPINEYTAEYFSPDKFEKNENKRPAIEYVKQFIHDKLAEDKFPINVAVFIYHRKEWLAQGRPDGAEYLKLQKQWETDDRAAGVDYEKANNGWESNT
ncbi:MAG: hypothetical protein J6Q48_08420 [Bacteroidaceae bacterium]|nr:hypothetical protein [Bacteroidaceae bacterium]